MTVQHPTVAPTTDAVNHHHDHDHDHDHDHNHHDHAHAMSASLRGEQTVTVADAGPARKSLTIEIPETRIAAKIKESFERLRKDANLPGFRRGKAPQHLLQKRFGDSIRDEVRTQLLSESYTQAIEDEKIDVIGEPEVKDYTKIVLPETGPLSFKVEVEVSPKVELPAFETITVKKEAAVVSDADVDGELKELSHRHGKMTEAPDGEAKPEDYVQSDVKIFAGHDVATDTTAKALHEQPGAYILVHGADKEFKGHVAGIVVSDLGKQVTGKKVGDQLNINYTGPAGHENEEIRNQPITIQIKITKIERIEPAALDSLAPRFGLASVDELKSKLKEMLLERKERQQQQAQHQQICTQLLEKVAMELPAGLSGRQALRVLRRKAMELSYAGVPEREIEQRIAEMRAGSTEEAARQLKLFFILDKAAEQFKVEVDDSEVNGRIAMLAMQQGRRPEKLRQQMMRSGEIDQIYLQIREQKTLDAILAKAQITEA